MKKAVFLLLGSMMIAGGLLVSCQKKEPCKPAGQPTCKPLPPKHPCSPCGPCKRY
ncbi:MAG: hypothetical protein H7A38_04770 [Chlamydiales bacterium]|nr:hypothetical protein [Chlamydiales bacterium]